MINISGLNEVVDPFYRYTMHIPIISHQKNKTVISNISIIAKDLGRDPNLLVEFIKKKYSVSMTYKDEVLTTTTKIESTDLHATLREFIEYLVLCERCRLPETILTTRGSDIVLDCKCCSTKTIVDKTKSKTLGRLFK